MDAVSVRDLRKSFKGVEAVRGISFDVPEGSFFAFLGPNGAGKSTTISIICSLLKQDEGEVRIFGKDSSDPSVRMDIGIVFQDSVMDARLTVQENVRIRGGFYGLSGADLDAAVDHALYITGCDEFADRPYGKLSGGQRRRADIARALVHGPRLLLLDEPTSGLDPQTRKHIWDTVNDLNSNHGITVMLTTHYMEEAAGADDVVILNRGSIVVHDTPSMLRDRYCSDRMTFVPKGMGRSEALLKEHGVPYTVKADSIEITLASTIDAVPIIAILGDSMESLEVRSGTLDDAFINVTGEDPV